MVARNLLLATLLAALVAPAATADVGTSLNETTCAGSGVLELCFAPALDLGPVAVPLDATVDPGIGQGGALGSAGIVRLLIVPGVVEPALVGASIGGSDICATYAALPFACVPVLSLPIAAPAVDPDVSTTNVVLGEAILGTLTIKINGQTAAVLPGYVDITCPAGSTSHLLDLDCNGSDEVNAGGASQFLTCDGQGIRLLDADCDGWNNDAELAGTDHMEWSNPFYERSKPNDQGRGFPRDWDADGIDNQNELTSNPKSNPLQRCSRFSDPDGDGQAGGTWTLGDSCEDTGIIGFP